MSDLNKAILKVAQENPEFRRALVAELKKEAAPSNTLSQGLQAAWKEGVKAGDGSTHRGGKADVNSVKAALNKLLYSRAVPWGAIDTLAHDLAELVYEAGFNSKSF